MNKLFRNPLVVLAAIFVIVLGFPAMLALAVGQSPPPSPQVKAIPDNFKQVIEEADSQVGNSYTAVMKTTEGQAWASAQNYRDARIMFVMNELSLKVTEGWVLQRDKDGKVTGFVKKQSQADPVSAGKP